MTGTRDDGALTLLIVDDEPGLREVLRQVIAEREGAERYRLLEAAGGEEALGLCERERVDVVLTDIKMPGMDGFTLLKELKRHHPGIGVIVMTGYADIYSKKDALILGAEEYISKPFDNEEIHLVLQATYWKRVASRTEPPGEASARP
ncbi:MAG: response regulator [Planctomycetes bacterium]|nr:response regulator [Planctomycetota bacterium]